MVCRQSRWREKEQPHLILLDMLLPKMTGLDVLQALKKDPLTKAIAVVALNPALAAGILNGSRRMERVAFLD